MEVTYLLVKLSSIIILYPQKRNLRYQGRSIYDGACKMREDMGKSARGTVQRKKYERKFMVEHIGVFAKTKWLCYTIP